MSEKRIYKLSDDICFRFCEFSECNIQEKHWSGHDPLDCLDNPEHCRHAGDMHFHCPIHLEMELITQPTDNYHNNYICPICSNDPKCKPISSLNEVSEYEIEIIKQKAQSFLNSKNFKNAKLIRLDDYYVPEISKKDLMKKKSKYWASCDVKTTKSGEPLLILYVGNREDKSKAQFFIEPESKKLSHDHKDSDPLSIISRIEVKFKEGSIELKANDDTE